jgi:hypothetical protein
MISGKRAVSMDSDRPHARVKQKWLRILQKGAGSFVLAAAMVSAPSAQAVTSDAQGSVSQRVEHARERMQQGPPALDSAGPQTDELAWIRWGNLPMPIWNNWPNWHNWHNWPNWPNY